MIRDAPINQNDQNWRIFGLLRHDQYPVHQSWMQPIPCWWKCESTVGGGNKDSRWLPAPCEYFTVPSVCGRQAEATRHRIGSCYIITQKKYEHTADFLIRQLQFLRMYKSGCLVWWHFRRADWRLSYSAQISFTWMWYGRRYLHSTLWKCWGVILSTTLFWRFKT